MNHEKAQKIILLAVKKGLLHRSDLELFANGANESEILHKLIDAGLLGLIMVQALENEIEPAITRSDVVIPFQQITKNDNTAANGGAKAFAPVSVDSGSIYKALDNSLDLSQQSLARQFNQYALTEILGQGGMGKVFKAQDTVLKREVALKFIIDDDADARKRLVLESRALAKVDHKNICRVYEVGEADGKIFIALQYIDGKPLNKVAYQLTLEEKVRIVAEIAEGLQAVHEEGLIHRDIKPQNIMVERTAEGEWKPYLMDFGLVREIYQPGITETGNALGTPPYMSPEQIRGKKERMDGRADVYSLGATLYELLTGQLPFDGATAMDVLLKVLNEDALPIRKIDANMPIDLEIVVAKCLAKNPQQRYGSAQELADELQRFLRKEPIKARKASVVERAVHQYKKNKVVANLMLSVVMLGLIVLVLSAKLINWNFARFLPLPSSARPQMVAIPGGKFIMGSDAAEDEYAKPEHEVTVSPFTVSKTLITNYQYAEFIMQTGHEMPKHWSGVIPSSELANRPVVNISWLDANDYCQWLSAKTGEKMRLLSEAEWEFLARQRNQYSVSELMEAWMEWTGTAFSLYPQSKSKPPQMNITARIFRGITPQSKNEPVTFRFWQREDFSNKDLGFRVASDASN